MSRIGVHQCVIPIRPTSPGERVNISSPWLVLVLAVSGPHVSGETGSLLAKCRNSFVDTSNLLCAGVFDPAWIATNGYAVASQHIADSGDRCLHRPPPSLSFVDTLPTDGPPIDRCGSFAPPAPGHTPGDGSVATPAIDATDGPPIDRCGSFAPPAPGHTPGDGSVATSAIDATDGPPTSESAICSYGPCMWQATDSDVTVSVVERGGFEPPGIPQLVGPPRWCRRSEN